MLDEKISHRAQIERENDRDEEKKPDLRCHSEHPEQQQRQNHAGQNRRNSRPAHGNRRASQLYLFSSWISSTSTDSSSAWRPALRALLLAGAPAGRTPIFCFSATSCILGAMLAPPGSR